jgi:hypothetical protein
MSRWALSKCPRIMKDRKKKLLENLSKCRTWENGSIIVDAKKKRRIA